MSLLNYTTKIDAWATISEIQKILAQAGASHFNTAIEGKQPKAVSFTVDFKGTPLNFLLPCEIHLIQAHFENLKGADREKLTKNGFYANAKRDSSIYANIGWRILKDWIEAQCALITIGLAKIEVVFMPYMLNDRGETLAHVMLEGGGMKLLNSSK